MISSLLLKQNTEMDKSYLRGECLEIDTVNNGLCTGTFFSQNNDKSRIVLFNVKYLSDNNILKGYTYYYSSEIKSISRVTGELDVFLLSQMEYDTIQLTAKKYISLQEIDERFHLAIKNLNDSSYIGVGTDGTELGRVSDMRILTLTTPEQIYIFDIQTLEERAFTSGIKDLLENSLCKKIIHDSRNISDLLFHKYNVVLKHVFDTAVADVIISKHKHNRFPEEIKTLKDCLFSYMGLSDVIKNLSSTMFLNNDNSLEIHHVVAMNNAYLHCLKDIMKNRMTASLERGFECYLNIERRYDDFEAWTNKSDDKFPKAVQDEL